jgi:outer membrane protein assembly factor BamB
MRTELVSWLFLSLVFVSSAAADDWPQWLGPQRDSIWRETGIIETFPEAGLPVKWRAQVALGYSGPAVADGRVFVMDYVKRSGEVKNNPGGPDALEGTERILCLDAETGQEIWQHAYDRPYKFSYGGGPRCTPTVDGDRVYALGAEGNLWCLNAQSGQVIWSKDFAADYGAKTPFWGHASHPLVDGDLLLCVVGGEGSIAVGFDKLTGREVWRALSATQQGYCPPTIIEAAGVRQLLIWHAEALNGLNPLTGQVYWTEPLKPSYGMAIAPPRKSGSYLLATAYDNVGKLLKLDESKPAVSVVWQGGPRNAIYSANVAPILENGTIYGCDVGTGALMAVRLEDAHRLWQTLEPTTGGERRGRYGTAFLVKAADRYFLFNERGDLIIANLSPEGYQEISRTHVLDPTNQTFGRPVVWSHPAFARRCVFARNDRELVCVDLSADAAAAR